MKFKDLEIGDTFQFSFDSGGKWAYQKIGPKEILCVKTPVTIRKALCEKSEWDNEEQNVTPYGQEVFLVLCYNFAENEGRLEDVLTNTAIFSSHKKALEYKKSKVGQHDSFQIRKLQVDRDAK